MLTAIRCRVILWRWRRAVNRKDWRRARELDAAYARLRGWSRQAKL